MKQRGYGTRVRACMSIVPIPLAAMTAIPITVHQSGTFPNSARYPAEAPAAAQHGGQ